VVGGLPRELTIEEALFYRTYQDALNGSRTAIRAVMKVINEREARRSPDSGTRVVVAFECPHPQSVDQALSILEIATARTDQVRPAGSLFLQLEPWAVAAALARRAAHPIEQKDLKTLQQHTRDPGSVSWPEGVV
jgi:hypothetical protein